MQKVILNVKVHNEKAKRKAMKTVSTISGIESVSIEGQKLTAIGDVDPIEVVGKLRKCFHAEIVSVGPKEEEKDAKGEKKDGDGGKKDDANKPSYVCYHPIYYNVVPVDDYPHSGCLIL